MKFIKSFYFIGTFLTLFSSEQDLLADCHDQDVICCLEHNYPLGGPIAHNRGTCWTWPPSCAGIMPSCCICNHEQADLDMACHKAYPEYSPGLVTAELSQNCIPPHSKDKKAEPVRNKL